MNFTGRPEEKTNALNQQLKKTEFWSGGSQQPQTDQTPLKEETKETDKKKPQSFLFEAVSSPNKKKPSASQDMCCSPGSPANVDPVKLEERKKAVSRLLGSAGNSPATDRSSDTAEKANERRDLVSRMIGTTRVQRGRRGNDGCDSTVATLSLDGLDVDGFDTEKTSRPELSKLPSIVNITREPNDKEMKPPSVVEEGCDERLSHQIIEPHAVQNDVPAAPNSEVVTEIPEEFEKTQELPSARSSRHRRTGRKTHTSTVSVQVSVDSESLQRLGGSSISTISIKIELDDESIDTLDQNEALLNLINEAVATATADVSPETAITALPHGQLDNNSERNFQHFESHDDATAMSHTSGSSARRRRSTMQHMPSSTSKAHLQPPAAWLTGETTSTQASPLTEQDSNISATNPTKSFLKHGQASRSPSVNASLSSSCHAAMTSQRHNLSSSRTAASFRLPQHEASNRTNTTENAETASHGLEACHSMHNIGLHNRYGFMVDDEQAKRARRHNNLSWVSKNSEASADSSTDVPMVSAKRPSLLGCTTISEPTAHNSNKVEDMRRSWHQKSPSNRSLFKNSSRQLTRGSRRPPMSKSMSSRSLLKRTQMVRQTSTKSISRSSVVNNGDVGHSSSRRPSLLSRTSSISKMTVVYQETSCEFQESFDDLSNSDFGASIASFVPVEDDDEDEDDCMSRIDQPILEYEDQTHQAKGLKPRRMSSKSLYSLKSFRSIGKKLGLSRRKSLKSVQDEGDKSEQSVAAHKNSVTVVENNTKVFKRYVSNVLSFKIGANKKEVKPEPWMLLQSDQTSLPWHDHQDARMLTPYAKQESQEQFGQRKRRMRRRASM